MATNKQQHNNYLNKIARGVVEEILKKCKKEKLGP